MNHKRQKYCKHYTHHKITGYKPESRNTSSSKLWKGIGKDEFWNWISCKNSQQANLMNEDLHLETNNSTQTCHPVAMAMWQRKTALINNNFSDKWAYQLRILKQLLGGGHKTVVLPMRKMSSPLPDMAVSVFTKGIWAMTVILAQFKGKNKSRRKHNLVKYI